MLTLNEIANVSFRKSNFAGYKPEDVDEFIDKVVESYDLLIKKNIEQKELNEKLASENERLKNEAKAAPAPASGSAAAPVQTKVSPEDIKLSEECEYTQEEIKNALLSAQKLANATIREARLKAEAMISEANAKAERIVSVAQSEVNDQKAELDRLKKLVSDFRASLLDSYKEHLKLVNALPTQRSASAFAAAPKAEPAEKATFKAAEMTPPPVKEEAEPTPEPAEEPAPAVEEASEEELSQTKSFQIGKRSKGDKNDYSELKFGADYDINKG